MKIPIDKEYELTSDAHNFIISRKRIAQEGEFKGQEVSSQIGFYTTLSSALMGVLKHKLRDSTATNLKMLLDESRAFYEHLQKLSNENDNSFKKGK